MKRYRLRSRASHITQQKKVSPLFSALSSLDEGSFDTKDSICPALCVGFAGNGVVVWWQCGEIRDQKKFFSAIHTKPPHVDICWSHQTTKRFSLLVFSSSYSLLVVDFAISVTTDERREGKKTVESDTRREDSSALKILFTCSNDIVVLLW